MVVKKEGQKKKVFVELQNLVWFEDLQKRMENEGKEWLLRKKGRPIFPADAAIDPTNDSLTDCIRSTYLFSDAELWLSVHRRVGRCLGHA